MIAPDAVNDTLEVEIFGQKFPANISEIPSLWDPKNERLRA